MTGKSFTLNETIELTGLTKSRIRYLEARCPGILNRSLFSPYNDRYSPSQIKEFKQLNVSIDSADYIGEKVDKKQKIIVFASGKGGVGKTSLSVNLSIIGASKTNDTVFFDGDLGMADAHILLGVKNSKSLTNLFNNGDSLKELIVKTHFDLGFISGGNGCMELADLDDLSLIRLKEQLSFLQKDHDYLIIDSPAGIGKGVLSFIAFADELVVVVTPAPSSMLDSYGLIKSVLLKGFKGEIKVITNMVASQQAGLEAFVALDNCANKFLDAKLTYLGAVRKDMSFERALIKRIPLFVMNEFSLASKNMKRIADKLFEI